jgi:predicted SprT family Zn-dependent metalloprotease
MWTIKDVENECHKISAKMGDKFDIPVRVNGRLTRTLGRVTIRRINGVWYPEVMEISKQLLETATDESIKSVIEHEWCHYFTAKETGEDHGHDKVFKAMCARIGCDNDGTRTKVERTVEVHSKYEVYCGTCKDIIANYSRMSKNLQRLDERTCNRCKTSNLKLIQNW